MNVKCEYDEKLHALDARTRAVIRQEQELSCKEKNLDAEISKKANRMITDKRENMQRTLEDELVKIRASYNQKINAIYFVTCGSLLYDIFVTIFPLIKKNRFKHDVAAAGSFVWSVIVFFWTHGVSFSSTMWSMCIDIPVNILNTVVAVLAAVITFSVTVLLPYALILAVFYKIAEVYWDNVLDPVSAGFAAATFDLLVWFSDGIGWSFNLLLLWLILQTVYSIIKIFITNGWTFFPKD